MSQAANSKCDSRSGRSLLAVRRCLLKWKAISVLCLAHGHCTAQDIHFSQFFNVPMGLNPGSIGQFDGDYRAHGVFRQQWRSVTVPYRTFGMGGDARDFNRVKGLGLGAWLFNDRAGDSRMNQFHFSLGGSYTKAIDNRERHNLTLGAQIGITALTISNSGLSFDAQYNGFSYDPARDNGEDFARYGLAHEDLHAGLIYRFVRSPRQWLQAGFGLYNITRPGVGFLGEPSIPLDRRGDVHAMASMKIHDDWDVLPVMRWMAQGTFREFDLGANARYILLERYGLRRALLAGMHMRARDAGFIFAGLERDDWTFGMSYDINTSDLVPASRYRGAIEFTAIRIWKKRPPVPVRFKACPEQL